MGQNSPKLDQATFANYTNISVVMPRIPFSIYRNKSNPNIDCVATKIIISIYYYIYSKVCLFICKQSTRNKPMY